ncbi:MAG: hypothetical protein ACOH2C_25095, partial [Clostridium sp.]
MLDKYDFISRLWLSNLSTDRVKLKNTYSYKKKPSKIKATGKNKKLPNKKTGVVRKISDFFEAGRSFSLRAERLLQKIFSLVAVEPYFNLNLIEKDKLTVAGDGTCVHCKSSYYGSKVCDCRQNGIYDCKCPRRTIYLRFVEESRHDSVTGIVALAEFRELLPQFNISNYALDSANDNYPTYELCSKWNINPFIDLNSKNKGN